MAKNMWIIGILLIAAGLAGAFWYFKGGSDGEIIRMKIGGQMFELETARSMAQKAKGLSGRETLGKDRGMIFIYEKEGIYPFWMKDTKIPLDIIWINGKGEVVEIKTAVPQIGESLDKLKLYQNEQPAKYIIELEGGRAEKLGLKVGNKLTIPTSI